MMVRKTRQLHYISNN